MMCKDGIHYFNDPSPKSYCNCLLWGNKEFEDLHKHGKIKSHRRRLYKTAYYDLKLNQQGKPVIQVKDGQNIAVFRGLGEASKVTGVFRVCISDCLTGRAKTAGGYKWELA